MLLSISLCPENLVLDRVHPALCTLISTKRYLEGGLHRNLLATPRTTSRGGFSRNSNQAFPQVLVPNNDKKITPDSGVSSQSLQVATQTREIWQPGGDDVVITYADCDIRVFRNSSVSASIFGVPEALLFSMWELLKAVSSSEFQDVEKFRQNAR